MNCFKMKASSVDGQWVEFDISDIPTPIDETHFVTLARQNTPILNIEYIRRGDVDTGLFEGDVVEIDGVRWLVCYERGFYLINEEFVQQFPKDIEYKVLGTIAEVPMNIHITYKRLQLFKYKTNVFKMKDIRGAVNKNSLLLLSCVTQPVSPEDIQQDCCLTYRNDRIYLGDTIGDTTVKLHFGRICLYKNNTYIDITNGGEVCPST